MPFALAPAGAQTTDVQCAAPVVQPAVAPPDLRINGELVVSSLTSIMDTDSKPLTIDFPAGNSNMPLRVAIPDPNDSAHLLQLSDKRWVYSPASPLMLEWNATDGLSGKRSNVGQVDICVGDYYSRVQVWTTEYLPDLAARYPDPYRSPLPHRYDTPINFIQISAASEASRQLSTSFIVEQFLPISHDSTATHSWPQPLLIQMPLLEKLESVLMVLAENGKPTPTLTILSGYRTPRHNRRVGGAAYSRHLYGDAVDFIVDADNNGKMDDLNGDGKISRADLRWLLDRIARKSLPITAGGTGAYESHGQAEAFLHMDARGRTAYWQ